MRVLIEDMRLQWCELDRRIAEIDKEFAGWVRNERGGASPHDHSDATALIAAIGRADSFARGRDLAAWLGLVPRQVTIGGKPRLVGISKQRIGADGFIRTRTRGSPSWPGRLPEAGYVNAD
jgi:transposase